MARSYQLSETDKFVKKLHQLDHDTTNKVSGSGPTRGRCSRCAAPGFIRV